MEGGPGVEEHMSQGGRSPPLEDALEAEDPPPTPSLEVESVEVLDSVEVSWCASCVAG